MGRSGDNARRRKTTGRNAPLAFDILEDRRLMSVSGDPDPQFRDLVSVEVLDRQLFYNNSAFDGNNAAISADDDLAVASDKTALLPGGTASFANYSSYSRGINGVMIDVAGLPSWTLDYDDFEFRVGNVNDPASWTLAPTPTSLSIRSGAGISGSSRVAITWSDGAVKGQWLEVTLKANTTTGLKTPDVFYFGNAIGESGNSSSDAIVSTADVQGAANNPKTAEDPAAIDFAYDYNRDALVDATDQALASSNLTNATTALKLIQPPTKTYLPEPQRLQTALFNWGDGGFPVFNNPALVTTNDGTVLAFAEGRATKHDAQSYALVMRRSTDGGVTWSDPSVVYSVTPRDGVAVSQPTPIVDKITGDVVMLFNRGGIRRDSDEVLLTDVLVTRSSDDGLTWSAPVDITSSVKVMEGNNPGPPGVWPDTPWGWIVVGPGHGIQLQNGPHAGRLLVGGDHRYTDDTSGISWSHVMYSDDHGVTWHLGGGLPGADSPVGNSRNNYSNENTLVEVGNSGMVLMSARMQVQGRFRGRAFSTDGGLSFSLNSQEPDLFVYQVEASTLRLPSGVLLFSSPASTDIFDEIRHEMTIWASYDNGNNWIKRRVIYFGYSGYSDMTLVGPDTILLSFARGRNGGLDQGGNSAMPFEFLAEIALVRVNLEWLESTDPYEFDWNFNESAPGTTATSTGWSIQDYGMWDQRAFARADNPSLAAQYVPGAAGDVALHISDDSQTYGVVLTPAYNTALHVIPSTSFTVQLEMKTTDSDGVILGTRPDIRNWTLQIVDGRLQFSLFDTVNTPVITSVERIDDGQWHHIAAVRDAVTRKLRIYIDHEEAATEVTDTATKTATRLEHVDVDAVYLGTYNNYSPASRLDLTVDKLQFTRKALLPEDFFTIGEPTPVPPPPPTYLPNNPTSLPGLQLWMPAFDPTRYFTDYGNYASLMSESPFSGSATRSMIEASSNAFRLQVDNQFRQVLYGEDAAMGPYWQHNAAPGAAYGSEWVVHSLTSSSTPKNFDFVQNTGEFTLSTFLKLGASTGNYMTIFDTSEASQSKAGFSLFVASDGTVWLTVTGGTEATKRFYEKSPLPKLAADQWYHLAVVGSGPGSPVKFYLTAVSANQVTAVNSAASLAGANGTYATDSFHELVIGGRSGAASGTAPFNGGLVNQAIFDKALTTQQIQQLFLFGKGLTAVATPWQNSVQPLDVEGDGDVDARDVLVLNNWLLLNPSGALPQGSNPPPYYDVNGSNSISAADALQLINFVLLNPATPTATSLAAAANDSAADLSVADESMPDSDVGALPASEPVAVAAALTFSHGAWFSEASDEAADRLSDGALDEVAAPSEESSIVNAAATQGMEPLLVQPRQGTTGRSRSGSAAALTGLSLAARAADEIFGRLQ